MTKAWWYTYNIEIALPNTSKLLMAVQWPRLDDINKDTINDSTVTKGFMIYISNRYYNEIELPKNWNTRILLITVQWPKAWW